MAESEDLFTYAANKVANKPVMQRVWHSPRLHIIRSAVHSKGSVGSKVLTLGGAAARVALGTIPIPALGSFLSLIEKSVQGGLKGRFYKRRIEQALEAKDPAQFVKFELKDLSLEEMDRYRWKVEQTITDLNTALDRHQSNLTKKKSDGAECDAYLDLALAAEQATRRIEKLKHKCLTVKRVMEDTLVWLEDCEFGGAVRGEAKRGVIGKKNAILDELQQNVEEYYKGLERDPVAENEEAIHKRHVNCKHWCWYKDLVEADSLAGARAKAAKILKFLTTPFMIEEMGEPIRGLTEIGRKAG
jgi:hypothetical protein